VLDKPEHADNAIPAAAAATITFPILIAIPPKNHRDAIPIAGSLSSSGGQHHVHRGSVHLGQTHFLDDT
jgi:hypothetical protein